MNTQDIFTSTPLPGAVLRDWTHRTLTVDIENSIGETYHFEILPNEKTTRQHEQRPRRRTRIGQNIIPCRLLRIFRL